MKQVLDKIILVIFYILCLIAFFSLIEQLPIFISSFSNMDINKNIILFLLILIIGYTANYYLSENEKKGELEYVKLQTVKNIYTYDYNNLEIIQKIEFSQFNKVHIFLLNNYSFNIELENFIYIDNQEALEGLDNFINNLKYETEEMSIPFKYERVVTEYLTKLKKN